MVNAQSWSQYFKQLYKRKYDSLGKLAVALSKAGLDYDTTTLSRFQTGKRLPQDRQIHLDLIAAFVKLQLIKDAKEANKWLYLAGLRPLNSQELARYCQATIRRTH